MLPFSTYGPYSGSWERWGLASFSWSAPARAAFLSWWLEERRWCGTSERSSGRGEGVEAGLRCRLWGGLPICGAVCAGDAEDDGAFSKAPWAITFGKGCWPDAAGGLSWVTDLQNEAASSEFGDGSEMFAGGLSACAPLQCWVLCLLSMAERVKLFPQALQM